ncbi:winged helix-turn-helix domain-containing protein [Chloroflexota bacterium]
MIMSYLYFVDSADFLFLMRQTDMTWGNLSSHLSRLEAEGYLLIEKEFLNKKPHTMLRLTDKGRKAFNKYRRQMKQILEGISKS